MNIQINTLDYAKDLEKAGIVREHAEAIAQPQARTVKDLVDHELVTKDFQRAELTVLRAELRGDIVASADGLRQELRKEIDGVHRRIDGLQVQLRSLQFGGTIAAFVITAVVLLTRLIKYPAARKAPKREAWPAAPRKFVADRDLRLP